MTGVGGEGSEILRVLEAETHVGRVHAVRDLHDTEYTTLLLDLSANGRIVTVAALCVGDLICRARSRYVNSQHPVCMGDLGSWSSDIDIGA